MGFLILLGFGPLSKLLVTFEIIFLWRKDPPPKNCNEKKIFIGEILKKIKSNL